MKKSLVLNDTMRAKKREDDFHSSPSFLLILVLFSLLFCIFILLAGVPTPYGDHIVGLWGDDIAVCECQFVFVRLYDCDYVFMGRNKVRGMRSGTI